MPVHITAPTSIPAAGSKPKIIREFIGRMNTGTEAVSIAHMVSPSGWVEPAQRPEFDEYTLVLRGALVVQDEGGRVFEARAGEAIIARRGERIQYSTPGPEGAEYIAVCVPAFSPETVHRDNG
ncbi:MAG: cupin domain-containing protein [Candidatus Hydrogenedentes bacterium]|nr:cupin domain-containing protein [Candidatus Hydrogenedentota bacterium]